MRCIYPKEVAKGGGLGYIESAMEAERARGH
jgi:hypothetical protein